MIAFLPSSHGCRTFSSIRWSRSGAQRRVRAVVTCSRGSVSPAQAPGEPSQNSDEAAVRDRESAWHPVACSSGQLVTNCSSLVPACTVGAAATELAFPGALTAPGARLSRSTQSQNGFRTEPASCSERSMEISCAAGRAPATTPLSYRRAQRATCRGRVGRPQEAPNASVYEFRAGQSVKTAELAPCDSDVVDPKITTLVDAEHRTEQAALNETHPRLRQIPRPTHCVSRRAFLSIAIALGVASLGKPLASVAAAAAAAAPASSSAEPATTRIPGDVRILFSRAQRLEDEGEFQEALKIYASVVDREPGLVWAYANRANLYSRLGQYDQALADYTQAIRLLCKTVSGNESTGDERLTDADAPCLERELWVLYLNRATVYRTLRRHQEALRDMNRALSIRPYEPLLLVNRAMVYVDLAKYDAALLDYQRAVERRPGDVQPFWVDYALTLFQRGRDTDALGIMRRVASKPSFAQSDEVKAAYAVLLYDRGMLSDAEGLWGALQRPRRFQDENFLRNERHWPPRAIEVALRYHPQRGRQKTSSSSAATSLAPSTD